MASIPDIAIIAPGKVGTALGMLAARAGLMVSAVGARHVAAAETAADAIAAAGGARPRARDIPSAARGAGLVLLTASDTAIADVCAQMVAAGALARPQVVAHCSGPLASAVLAPARDAGCGVASMHPLQTFPSVEAGVEALNGAFFFCEGDAGAVEVVEEFAAAIGGRPVRISPESKALYHAAAAVACNYLPALVAAATEMLTSAGVSSGVAAEALGPIMRATLDNVLSLGPLGALTGPIARGDDKTVRRHVEAIRQRLPHLLPLYAALGRQTAHLAHEGGRIKSDQARNIERILSAEEEP